MYPSVSVCRKYAFDQKYLDFDYYYYNESKGVNTFIGWINDYSVGMEKQFYFLTLPGVENLTFPCTTKLGGMTPGRPCVFPFESKRNLTGPKTGQQKSTYIRNLQ